ncbi:ribonuclease T2 [Gastrophryne carolinensis]
MESPLRYTLLVSFILCAIHISFMDNSVTIRKHPEWKKLILTHHLPVTVCKMARQQCVDPPNYWTLHGVWTDKTQMCNHSWPFNSSEVQDLFPEMNKWWPDVLHPNHSQLWKHEWQKHGTCAASLLSLNTQHKYFSKGLDLFKSIALNSALEKARIKPAQTYKKEDLEHVFLSLYGVLPKIQCLPPDQGQDTQILGQIEICLTKDFNLENCTGEPEDHGPVTTEVKQSVVNDELHVCDKDKGIYYPSVE